MKVDAVAWVWPEALGAYLPVMGEEPKTLSDAAHVAVAVPIRLRMLILMESGSWSAGELAQELSCTRQLARHHLKALVDAGLAVETGRTVGQGGPTISYRSRSHGWADVVRALNRLAKEPDEDDIGA